MKNKATLILEVGERHLKVCQVDVFKKKRVVSLLEVFEFPAEIIDRDVVEVLSKFPEKCYEKVIISFLRTFFMIRFLKLPSENIDEVRKMIPFQLSKIVPCPLDKCSYDFSMVGVKEGFSRLLVFIVQNKKLMPILKPFSKRKITAEIITVSSYGLNSWLTFQDNFFKEDASTIVLVDIDKYCSDFLVIDKEKGVLFTRSFLYSDQSQILEGIQQSLRIFRKEFGNSVFDRVIFTGERKEKVMEAMDIGESKYISPWDNAFIQEEIKEKVKDTGFSFASILGLSIAMDDGLGGGERKGFKRKAPFIRLRRRPRVYLWKNEQKGAAADVTKWARLAARITRLWRVYIPPKADPPSEESTAGLPAGCSISRDSQCHWLDFSPEPLKAERKIIKKKTRYVEIAIIGLEVFLIATVFLSKYLYDKTAYLRYLDTQLQEMRPKAKGLDELSEKLKILDGVYRGRASFSEILFSLISSISKNITLTLVDFQENGDFFFKGYAQDISNVFKTVDLLEDSSFFQDVKVKYASKIKDREKIMVEYYIYGKVIKGD